MDACKAPDETRSGNLGVLAPALVAQGRPRTVVLPVSVALLWRDAVQCAQQPALVVDEHCVVVSCSQPARALLGVDFGVRTQDLPLEPLGGCDDWTTVPFARAALEGVQQRGLVRLRRPDRRPITLDVVATPLYDGARVSGALAFLAEV